MVEKRGISMLFFVVWRILVVSVFVLIAVVDTLRFLKIPLNTD